MTLYLQVAVSIAVTAAFTAFAITAYDNKYLAKVATVLLRKRSLILSYRLVLIIVMFVLANLHFLRAALMLLSHRNLKNYFSHTF